jgi:hypothetical protein
MLVSLLWLPPPTPEKYAVGSMLTTIASTGFHVQAKSLCKPPLYIESTDRVWLTSHQAELCLTSRPRGTWHLEIETEILRTLSSGENT